MIEFYNVKKNNTVISAEYEIEHSGSRGNVTVDLKSGSIIDRKLTDYEKGTPRHTNMILRSLINISTKQHIPDQYYELWY
ncbi:MAG: hypothetical protein IKD69_14945 [Solobacterium sp.]|nr:hypothetical protein [Solobacterium sp.]